MNVKAPTTPSTGFRTFGPMFLTVLALPELNRAYKFSMVKFLQYVQKLTNSAISSK